GVTGTLKESAVDFLVLVPRLFGLFTFGDILVGSKKPEHPSVLFPKWDLARPKPEKAPVLACLGLLVVDLRKTRFDYMRVVNTVPFRRATPRQLIVVFAHYQSGVGKSGVLRKMPIASYVP